MPIKSFIVLPAALLLASVGSLSASAFNLEASIGGSNTAFPTGSYGFLVADTAGDGFEFLSDTALLLQSRNASVGDLIGGNDVVFSVNLLLQDFGSAQNGFVLSLTNFNTQAINLQWDAGDQFGLVWLQGNTSDAGDSFGFFRSNSAGSGTIGFSTPATGPDQTVTNLAQGISGGSTPVGDYTLNNGTIAAIPEPATILLIGFAPILLRLLRSARARRA